MIILVIQFYRSESLRHIENNFFSQFCLRRKITRNENHSEKILFSRQINDLRSIINICIFLELEFVIHVAGVSKPSQVVS